MIRGEEIDRFELGSANTPASATPDTCASGDGWRRCRSARSLDETGTFTWAPGVGFVGAYDLVFVRWADGRAVARRDVRIILAPKGSGHVGTQVVIDTPRPQQDIAQPFVSPGGPRIWMRRRARASTRCTCGRIQRRVARRCFSASPRSAASVPTWPRCMAINSARRASG